MNKELFLRKKFHAGNEKGAILIVGLLVILVLTVLSMAAMMSTGTELRIAANDRSAKEVFYTAEAGLEDARSRLQTSATAFPLSDNQPTNASWTAFIGPEERAQAKGYQASNSNQVRYDKLNSTSMDYVVTVTHKVDASNNILKWGDGNYDGISEENTTSGTPIYIITSEGHTSTGATKSVQIEAVQAPPITAPAALYTKEVTTIQGTSTNVLGMDGCGGANVPGIISMATVSQNGHPMITGSPAAIIEKSPMNIDVKKMINQFKTKADYSYNVNSATLTGMQWGNPTPGGTQQCATSCSDHNIVYFNTNSTYVKLTGQSSGCGILLVEGDLEIHGGFQWYGVILVTGSIIFTGGGGKNVTGAALAGANASADLVGGDANIVYCSKAVNNQTNYMPLVTLRWAEIFG
ncbi:MAG: PilX N-terminal domain-containing pilus assembly protein [Thermodesulfobacteriota bacterium]|jgi:type IV pilus assembly protein PilX